MDVEDGWFDRLTTNGSGKGRATSKDFTPILTFPRQGGRDFSNVLRGEGHGDGVGR